MTELVLALRRTLVRSSTTRAGRIVYWVLTPLRRVWRMAESHGLNPWMFIIMSLVGYTVQSMIYLPIFQTQAWRLTFLILLRVIALVIPTYILLKGKGIAKAFNGSIAAMFVINTTWHVCYYVYL